MAKEATKAMQGEIHRKKRKPRTTDPFERLNLVNERIESLERLIEERQDLIDKTEAKLNERKDALAKNRAALAKNKDLRDRILFGINNPDKKSALRIQRAEEKAKYQELAKLLKAQGKSVDDMLEELKK